VNSEPVNAYLFPFIKTLLKNNINTNKDTHAGFYHYHTLSDAPPCRRLLKLRQDKNSITSNHRLLSLISWNNLWQTKRIRTQAFAPTRWYHKMETIWEFKIASIKYVEGICTVRLNKNYPYKAVVVRIIELLRLSVYPQGYITNIFNYYNIKKRNCCKILVKISVMICSMYFNKILQMVDFGFGLREGEIKQLKKIYYMIMIIFEYISVKWIFILYYIFEIFLDISKIYDIKKELQCSKLCGMKDRCPFQPSKLRRIIH